MNSLAVAILAFNSSEHLKKFLPNVLKYSTKAKVYVIDNGSTDDTMLLLENHFPEVNVIQNGENLGYAGGYQKGLLQLKEEYWLLLNADAEVQSEYVEEAIKIFEQNPSIGAFQPAIVDYIDQNKYEYAGASGGFIDFLGYPFSRGRIFSEVERINAAYQNAIPVFWASGAALFVRKDAFWETGGFDTAFFAHMEEIDLCWKMQLLDYKIYCFPEIVFFHLGGGALSYGNPKKTFLNFRNNLWMLTKNDLTSALIWKLPIRLGLDGLAGLQFLLKGDINNCFAIIKAHFSFYRNFVKILNSRKFINPKRPMQALDGVYYGSILWQYYIKGVRKFNNLKF